MKSKTKYYIGEDKIAEIFNKAQLGAVESVVELTAGEFNSAYLVRAKGVDYVLKIAPKDFSHTLTYEKDIMPREVDFYKIIAEKIAVKTPKIYYYDYSKSIISSKYFIMEKLDGKPLNECGINEEERAKVRAKIGEMVAALHGIKGAGFGYEQNGLQDNWYLAIKSMTLNLIDDCKSRRKKAKGGEKLLAYIEKSRDILMAVEPNFTHFDIWDGNIFYKNVGGTVELSLIDTERGFWGDGIGDFVSIEMFKGFKDKQSINAYNKTAERPITFTVEELIRYNILKAYLGLIVHTEKFARYKLWQSKYYINIGMAKMLLGGAFAELDKLL